MTPRHSSTIDLDGARLRPLRVDDAPALYAHLRDPAVTELTSYPVMSVEFVESMIERSLVRWAAGEPSRWGVVLPDDDQLVGTCGFNEWSRVHRWAEVGFDLAQAHWGKGLMRQVVAAVLQWTFRQDQIDRVHAFVRVDNRRSARLLERSGFVREGCLRSYRVCRGQPHDFYVYALLRSDWVAAQPTPVYRTRMTLEEVNARAEKSWYVWGPCSGGVIVVHFCEGKLYTYYGGDARPADDDAPNPVGETIEDYARSRGDAEVMDWLRATGRL